MKTILIVEDDAGAQTVLKTKLSGMYLVLTARTAMDGWNIVQKEHADLIILDIMLPGGMNGFDLLEKLKKDPRFAATPVLVLTNLDSEETATRKIGVADYLVKANTSIDDIAAKVTAILGASSSTA